VLGCDGFRSTATPLAHAPTIAASLSILRRAFFSCTCVRACVVRVSARNWCMPPRTFEYSLDSQILQSTPCTLHKVKRRNEIHAEAAHEPALSLSLSLSLEPAYLQQERRRQNRQQPSERYALRRHTPCRLPPHLHCWPVAANTQLHRGCGHMEQHATPAAIGGAQDEIAEKGEKRGEEEERTMRAAADGLSGGLAALFC
jgi:hypothetical protein